MPIPKTLHDALLDWVDTQGSSRSDEEERFAHALHDWLDDGDVASMSLASRSHGLLSELQRLGRRSLDTLLARLVEDGERMACISRTVEAEGARLGVPNHVSNSIQSILSNILHRYRASDVDLYDESNLDAYVVVGCRNELIKLAQRSGAWSPAAELGEDAGPSPSPLDSLIQDAEAERAADTLAQFRGAIDALPPEDRAIVTLHAYEQWSFSELAVAFPERGIDAANDPTHHARRSQQIRRLVLDVLTRTAKNVPEQDER